MRSHNVLAGRCRSVAVALVELAPVQSALSSGCRRCRTVERRLLIRGEKPEAEVAPVDSYSVVSCTGSSDLLGSDAAGVDVGQVVVPRCRLNTYGRRAFSIAGPTVWNSLPDELRDPACGSDSFKQFLKTILFSLY